MSTDKELGDTAFRTGRHSDAIKHYTDALAADPRSPTLLNNRSAAYHKLGKYENALDDANKSTGIESTARGYQRVGNAYWSMGRFEQAVMAFERSLSITPSTAVQQDLDTVRRLAEQSFSQQRAQERSQQAQSTPQAQQRNFFIDLAIVSMSVFHLICMLISYSTSLWCWKGALVTFGLRQYFALQASGQLQFNMESLKKLSTTFSLQYLILCLALVMTGAPPQLLLLMAICIYTAFEVNKSRALLMQPPFNKVAHFVTPQLDKMQAQRDQYMAQAAMCEIMTGVMFMFSGGSLMGMMLVFQFLKYRYVSDTMMKMAFRAVAEGAGKLFYHPRCPSAIGNLYTKFQALLHRLAVGQ